MAPSRDKLQSLSRYFTDLPNSLFLFFFPLFILVNDFEIFKVEKIESQLFDSLDRSIFFSILEEIFATHDFEKRSRDGGGGRESYYHTVSISRKNNFSLITTTFQRCNLSSEMNQFFMQFYLARQTKRKVSLCPSTYRL